MSACAVMQMHPRSLPVYREKRDAFFAKIQDALSAIPSGKSYAVLSDFTAGLGVGNMDDEWWYEKKPMGMVR